MEQDNEMPETVNTLSIKIEDCFDEKDRSDLKAVMKNMIAKAKEHVPANVPEFVLFTMMASILQQYLSMVVEQAQRAVNSEGVDVNYNKGDGDKEKMN